MRHLTTKIFLTKCCSEKWTLAFAGMTPVVSSRNGDDGLVPSGNDKGRGSRRW